MYRMQRVSVWRCECIGILGFGIVVIWESDPGVCKGLYRNRLGFLCVVFHGLNDIIIRLRSHKRLQRKRKADWAYAGSLMLTGVDYNEDRK